MADKLVRLANDKEGKREDDYMDLAGYALRGVHERRKAQFRSLTPDEPVIKDLGRSITNAPAKYVYYDPNAPGHR